MWRRILLTCCLALAMSAAGDAYRRFPKAYPSVQEDDLRADSSIKVRVRPELNSFNVGYDLNFSGNNYNNKLSQPMEQQQQQQQQQRFRYDNAEVITGRRKYNERPEGPTFAASPQSYHQQSSSASGLTYDTQQNIFNDVIRATRPDEFPEERASFDHRVALRHSQPFDFSNAFGEDSVTAGSSNGGGINVEAHIPKHLRGVKPLPLDTTLLRDPVLTTNPAEQTAKLNGRVVPVHLDLRPIQTAMTQLHQQQQQQQQPQQRQNAFGDHASAASQLSYRTPYGQEDVYKMVSLRPPPPVAQQHLGY